MISAGRSILPLTHVDIPDFRGVIFTLAATNKLWMGYENYQL